MAPPTKPISKYLLVRNRKESTYEQKSIGCIIWTKKQQL